MMQTKGKVNSARVNYVKGYEWGSRPKNIIKEQVSKYFNGILQIIDINECGILKDQYQSCTVTESMYCNSDTEFPCLSIQMSIKMSNCSQSIYSPFLLQVEKV